MTSSTAWDPQAADNKAEEFEEKLAEIEERYPDAMREIREAWQAAYRIAGHKRLGRVLVNN